MRIISGNLKGRPITAPTGQSTRPTSDRARGAIFNVIAHAPWAPPLEGAHIMDLFAGSGALGFEALSRGASSCIFVEMATAAIKAISTNIDRFGLADQSSISRRSVAKLGARDTVAPRDLIFMDPPYGKDLVPTALDRLVAGDWMAPSCVVIVETGEAEELTVPNWMILDERVYGAARLYCLSAQV